MGWLKKKSNPFSERAKELTDEIALLEAEIKRLDSQMGSHQGLPRLRSTAVPHGGTIVHPHTTSEAPASPPPSRAVPVFVEVSKERLNNADHESEPELYNDLGVRKYDFTALLRRVRNYFSGPAASNPKLVNYLAAGGIQGLRPMRYERRVARNRFIFLTICLFLALLGTFWMFFHRR